MSNYFQTLNDLDKSRYLEKLRLENGEVLPDPLDEKVRFRIFNRDHALGLPNLAYADLYNYLINTPGKYTAESLKAYKSLTAYNYFITGKIKDVCMHVVGEVWLMYAAVEPSQKVVKMKSDLHQACVSCRKDGRILSGHCTCMAGLGEVCSHVAAILFSVEAAVTSGKEEKACTSKLCEWIQTKREVPTARIQDMTFKKPKYGMKPCNTAAANHCNPTGEGSFKDLISELKAVHPTSVLFKLTEEPGSSTDTASETEEECRSDLGVASPYKQRFLNKLRVRKNSETTALYTAEELKKVEAATTDQANSELWAQQRIGRVTASKFHTVCRSKSDAVKRKLANSLFNPINSSFTNAAVRWGRDKEDEARRKAVEILALSHTNFQWRKSGLHILKEHAYVGASPDALVSCDCCGDGVMEIKCPYSYKDINVNSPDFKPINPTTFCLNSNGLLKQQDKYYYQIQGQMLVTGHKYGYFVLWTEHSTKINVVEYNDKFSNDMLEKLKSFYLEFMIPVLTTSKED